MQPVFLFFYPDMSESILLLLFKFIIMVFKVAEKKREIQQKI